MVGVACLSMAMGVLAARCSAIATQGFARNMRSTLLGKIESFSFSNIDHISTPPADHPSHHGHQHPA